jgi:hypothetical protein
MSDKKKKIGFIRVFEIVLFTFLLFGILVPNFFRYSDFNEWESAKNLLISHDLLFALEKNKVLDDVLITDPQTDGYNISYAHLQDQEKIKNISEKVLPVIYDFEYEVKNVPASRISIGCACTDTQIQWLKEKILTPSYPTYEFAINIVPLNNLSTRWDTFVIFGQQNLEPYRNNITEMLKNGKGFVLIGDITSPPDNMTKELFDIDYSGGSSGEVNFQFKNLSDPVTSGIAKRYVGNLIRINTLDANLAGKLYLRNNEYVVVQDPGHNCINISSCSQCLHENETCSIANVANITLYMIDPLYNKWADIKISSSSANKRNYVFQDRVPLSVENTKSTMLSDSSHSMANAVMGSYSLSYELEPRRFWIYNYNESRDDLNLILKTGIIWSSGEHYFVFNKVIPDKRDVATHFYTGLRNDSIPFTVKLYTWGY